METTVESPGVEAVLGYASEALISSLLVTGIRHYFESTRKRNASFSVRALARKLGMSAPTLSRILAGKRSLGKESRQKLLKLLQSDPVFGPILDPSPNPTQLATPIQPEQLGPALQTIAEFRDRMAQILGTNEIQVSPDS